MLLIFLAAYGLSTALAVAPAVAFGASVLLLLWQVDRLGVATAALEEQAAVARERLRKLEDARAAARRETLAVDARVTGIVLAVQDSRAAAALVSRDLHLAASRVGDATEELRALAGALRSAACNSAGPRDDDEDSARDFDGEHESSRG